MQKLKDLIQALMEAFISFKRAFISNQAMPGDTDVIVSANPSSTNPVRFIAPSDGYVYVSDRGVNNQVSSLEINHADYGPFGTRSFGDGNSIIRLIFPVKKGRSVDINFSNTALTDIVCRFRATIGGGLNTILQAIGGDLCLLSHSFNRFLSSLVAKQCRANQTLIFRSPCRGNGVKPSLLPMMDTLKLSFSTQTRSNFQTLQQPFEQNPIVMSPQGFISPFIKAINLTFILTTKIQKELISRLSKQSAQANLCLQGGAL